MRRTFKDDKLQEAFDRTGFVKLQVLTPEEIKELTDFRASVKREQNERFNTHNANDKDVSYHFTFLDSNKSLKDRVFQKVSDMFQPKLDHYLVDFEPLVINFVNKEPGLGEVPVHQNWNFVDERDFTSVSVWCPLVDVGLENGALEFVPGTHILYRNDVLRSPSIPWYFTDYIEELKSDFLEPVPVKAGEILIFDDSIIHYSKPNRGDYDRLVIQIIAKPKDAQAKHYYMKKKFFGQEVEEMDVGKDFFLNFKFEIKERPDTTHVSKVQKIDHKPPRIPLKKFRRDYREYCESVLAGA